MGVGDTVLDRQAKQFADQQVAILGVSRASTEPVWDGEQFHPGLVMPLSLTYDHRVIDGADGARFLRWICQAIEKPINLVMKG